MKKKIITEILRLLVTALATGLGLSVCSGCACIPNFNFF